MLRLVGEGAGDTPVRRRAPLAELDLERSEDVAEVLETLADSRLVTVGEGSVEVAHEALLREWPRLRTWIEEDAEGRRLRSHITQAATDWNGAGRDQGELYRGARLAAALDWSTDHALELNELEREFVTQSREASELDARRARRTNRRLRGLLVGVALLLAAAVVGGVFAVVQRGEARDAEKAQLAQRLGAQALVEDDLDLSLLLARQAVEIDDSPQTRSYLLADLLRSPQAIGIMHWGGESAGLLRWVAVSPDGATVAIAVEEGGLQSFDARTFRPIGRPLALRAAGGLAYSPDGRTLAVGEYGRIRLLDARTHEQRAEARIGKNATNVMYTSDGSRLVVVESELGLGTAWIRIRDASTLEPIGRPIRPEGFTGLWLSQTWSDPGIALTPDGRSLMTTSVDGELSWWDLRSGEKTRTLAIAAGYRALALSPDGRTAAIGLDDGIQLIDVRTGAARQSTGNLTTKPVWLLFSPDGKTLVSTSLDATVTVWDVGSATRREVLMGHAAAVQQPIFSPNGKTLYTASQDGTAIAWVLGGDRGLGRPFRFTRSRPFRRDQHRYPGRFVQDGRLIAVALEGRGIQVRDAGELEPAGAPLSGTGGEVTALTSSPDGRTLAAGTANGKLTLWDLASRTRRWGPVDVSEHEIHSVSFDADGTVIATAAEGGMRLWDVATGVSLGTLGDGRNGTAAFSPTEPLLVFVRAGWENDRNTEGGGDVEFWDMRRRSLIRRIDLDYGLYEAVGNAVAFAPDGDTVATSGLEPFVHLWDAATGKPVGQFEQNVGGVETLDFSPDGSILALSGFGEPFASLVDVATGEQIGPRLPAGRENATVDISPDGRYLLQTQGNGEGVVWDIDPESWKRRACALANRTLTRAEWDKLLPGRPYEPACQD
jgi:WD40 repeat protein